MSMIIALRVIRSVLRSLLRSVDLLAVFGAEMLRSSHVAEFLLELLGWGPYVPSPGRCVVEGGILVWGVICWVVVTGVIERWECWSPM